MEEVTVHTGKVGWEVVDEYPSGASLKVLRRGAAGEPRTVLLKLEPGFEMNAHTHVYVEHHYVLEGEYESQNRLYPAGSYRMIPRHMDHGPFRSAKGAVILVIWE